MWLLIKHIVMKVCALFFRDNGPKVVYYHDVGTTYTTMGTAFKLLESHVARARRMGFSFVSAIEELNSQKKLLVCFDDGFRGLWDYREYFIKEGIRPIVFIAVDLVGQPGYLTWDEICNLQQQGFVFQSHTWSHRSLTDVSESELRHELADARTIIGRKLGCVPDMLCFPRGMYSQRIAEAAKAAGYVKLFASYPGCVDLNESIIPRNLVQNLSVTDFSYVLHGALCPFRNRYMRQHFKK